MKFLVTILLVFNAAAGGRAQNVTQTVSATAAETVVGIPLVVEKKSARLTFRATLDGQPIPVEKIEPSSSPLRLVVIDCRRDVLTSGKLPDELRSLSLPVLKTRLILIKVRRAAATGGESEINLGFLAVPDWQTALIRAETIFAAGDRNERQALLVIGENPVSGENPVGEKRHPAAVPSAAGRLITVIGGATPLVSPSKAARSLRACLEIQFSNLTCLSITLTIAK